MRRVETQRRASDFSKAQLKKYKQQARCKACVQDQDQNTPNNNNNGQANPRASAPTPAGPDEAVRLGERVEPPDRTVTRQHNGVVYVTRDGVGLTAYRIEAEQCT